MEEIRTLCSELGIIVYPATSNLSVLAHPMRTPALHRQWFCPGFDSTQFLKLLADLLYKQQRDCFYLHYNIKHLYQWWLGGHGFLWGWV